MYLGIFITIGLIFFLYVNFRMKTLASAINVISQSKVFIVGYRENGSDGIVTVRTLQGTEVQLIDYERKHQRDCVTQKNDVPRWICFHVVPVSGVFIGFDLYMDGVD